MIRAGLVLLVVLGCVACGGTQRAGAPAAMHIELLGFAGCPETPTMRRNLAAALRSIDPGLGFEDVDQERLALTDVRRGYPAPTVLVDGADLFGMPTPTAPAMGCRVYPGGVPGAGEIARRLRGMSGER